MPGAMPGMAGVMPAAPPPAPSVAKGEPLERFRPNPFSPPGGEIAIARIGDYVTPATTYGPDWGAIPITTRVAFVRPQRPERPEPPEPPPPTAKRFLRVSMIMWREGVPTATYETIDGKSGIIQPGDWVEEWQVLEMGQDYIIVKNRDTGEIQRVFLKGK